MANQSSTVRSSVGSWYLYHSESPKCRESPRISPLRIFTNKHSLIYVFRLMTCEAYYTTHPSPPGPGDRCSNHSIEAGTARAVALLGASTTLFGVLNLFVTAWAIRRFGIKTALLISVFWPAVRLAVQNAGVQLGGARGIVVIQASQVITVLGGPAGYLLALNSYVTEIIEARERTGGLGKLQGCSFFGTASAYLIGGLISDVFGIAWPFRVTLGLFLSSCVYVLIFLPWLPLNSETATPATGVGKFFGPLKTFIPHKYISKEGTTRVEYGTILLAIGVFLGVLATGYQSVLLQMFATDVFHFGTTENGYLISLNVFVRGLFLTLVFPRMISSGRAWFSRRTPPSAAPSTPPPANAPPPPTPAADLAADLAAVDIMDEDAEPMPPAAPALPPENYAFDLAYTRYSLLVDGALTGAATLIGAGWQMYAIAVVLPFASGTGSSAKGTILQMCAPGERADALSGITLVEMVARLTTSKSSLCFWL
jgi:MFS family permease